MRQIQILCVVSFAAAWAACGGSTSSPVLAGNALARRNIDRWSSPSSARNLDREQERPFARLRDLEEAVRPVTIASAAHSPSGPSPITGSREVHYVTDNGIVNVPADFTATSPPSAWVFNQQSGFAYYLGEGLADGTFDIPGVPAASYYLKFGATYVVTPARQLNLATYSQGRPDSELVGPNTVLNLDLVGLNPWQLDDDVELYSSNSGAWTSGVTFFDLDGHFPQLGETRVTERMNYSAIVSPRLIDAGQGDHTTFYQLSTNPGPGGTRYAAAAKKVDTSSLSLVNGGTASFSGTLTEILQDQSWSRTLDFASLHAYRSQIHPTAEFAEDDVYISVLPAGNAFGFYDAAPDLVEMLFYAFPIGQESFTFIYANPFPQWKDTFVDVGAIFSKRYQLPPANPTSVFTFVHTADTRENFPNPFRLQISPPQNFLINGLVAYEDRSDISTTPYLSWDPPAEGTATHYWLRIRELFVDMNRTRSRPVASVFTADTQLLLPPDIIEPGKSYFFQLIAVNDPGRDIQLAPFLRSFPESSAPTLTGVLGP